MEQSRRGNMAGLRRRRRRWGELAQRGVPYALLTAGLVAFCESRGHASPAADALPFLTAALFWRWWWPSEEGLPGALRLRRRSRGIALRAASLPAVGATIALAVAAREHGAAADGAAQAALWLAVAASVPVLLEPAAWLLAPEWLRRDVRLGALVEGIQELNSGPSRLHPLAFDPDLGFAGRVVPERSVPRPEGPGEPIEAVPDRLILQRAVGLRQLSFTEERWLANASLVWNGSALVATNMTGLKVGAPSLPGAYSLPGEPVELVWVVEQRDSTEPASLDGLKPASGGLVRMPTLLLLDAEDRRLLTMSGLGLDEHDVQQVATAAGLAFSSYLLRLHGEKELGERGLLPRMFVRARGMVHFRVPLA